MQSSIDVTRSGRWSARGELEGSLLRQKSHSLRDITETLPLQKMTTGERLVADYAGTGLTIDKHPMHHRRSELRRRGVLTSEELRKRKDGEIVRAAGCVIARQRPGTAKGFIFISMEDETGIANVIVTSDLYERQRLLVMRSKIMLVEGLLQNQDNVIHVKAARLYDLSDDELKLHSHDFH
jgi:error-prone DNA polymerase